ncbi:MAG: SMC-Scp complex subunit ScpB [Sneathiellaceae bacterium]
MNETDKDEAAEGPGDEDRDAAAQDPATDAADRTDMLDRAGLAVVQDRPPTAEHVRILEAVLFAAEEPLDEASLRERLPAGVDLKAVLARLAGDYAERGIRLARIADRWAFHTAPDLAPLLRREREVPRKLSRAAVETLAVIAYHQPVTRAEIEEIRGVSLSKGTLDALLLSGWVRLRGRRKVPGRPVTYGTTDEFMIHFALESLDDLPGIEELRAAGLLDLSRDAELGFPAPGEAPPGEEVGLDDADEDDGEAADSPPDDERPVRGSGE